MKKAVVSILVVLALFSLTGCSLFGPEEKEFTGSGITITLTDEFWAKETVAFPMYLESIEHIFTGGRELIADVSPYGIHSLSEYAEAVMDNSNHGDVTIQTRSENGASYVYAYYTATVDEVVYGYMLICMAGPTHYYAMNFGCLNKNLENNKAQYLTWADTITVS